jgi:hypothetical protein
LLLSFVIKNRKEHKALMAKFRHLKNIR